MKPLVSLIIPVFNVEPYLQKTILSAINQSLDHIEIILVNDGSTDNSEAICRKFASIDSRIRLINQSNQGLSAARNKGLQESKGEFIAFLDGDDTLHFQTLQSCYKAAMTYQADMVIFGYEQINIDGQVLYRHNLPDNLSTEHIKKNIISAKMSPMACNKFYRRKLFLEHAISFPENRLHEDTFTTYKLAFYARHIHIINQPFYQWLRREGSISTTITKRHIDDIFASLREQRTFLEHNHVFYIYYQDYIRRAYAFAVLMLERIDNSNYKRIQKFEMKRIIIQHLKRLHLLDRFSLTHLYYIDRSLFQQFHNKRKRMLKKIVNTVFPYDSTRRQILKRVLKPKPSVVKPEKKPVNNMLEVLKDITPQERQKLQAFKNKFEGKRCFIVGNGPSLNKCDLTLLKDEYTFAVNGIFYKTDEMGFMPTFYMVEDGHVIDDNLSRINTYNPPYKFFPALYKNKIVPSKNTYFFAADLGFYRENHPFFEQPRFSKDFSKVAYAGQSVTYLNIQLAYYMGFTEVYLIGMDFSYQIRQTDEVKGATLITYDEDVNHFHPDYFGKGKKWHDPKVHNVAKNYKYAKQVFEQEGRKIYNATIGGKLEIFERVDYNSLFN